MCARLWVRWALALLALRERPRWFLGPPLFPLSFVLLFPFRQFFGRNR